MSVANTYVNKVISLKYAGGSHPNQVRKIFVTKCAEKSIFGYDLSFTGTIKNFLVSQMSDVKVLLDFGRKNVTYVHNPLEKQGVILNELVSAETVKTLMCLLPPVSSGKYENFENHIFLVQDATPLVELKCTDTVREVRIHGKNDKHLYFYFVNNCFCNFKI